MHVLVLPSWLMIPTYLLTPRAGLPFGLSLGSTYQSPDCFWLKHCAPAREWESEQDIPSYKWPPIPCHLTKCGQEFQTHSLPLCPQPHKWWHLWWIGRHNRYTSYKHENCIVRREITKSKGFREHWITSCQHPGFLCIYKPSQMPFIWGYTNNGGILSFSC
jgi:hypothetical protein